MSPPSPRGSLPWWLPALAVVALLLGLGVTGVRYFGMRFPRHRKPSVSEVKMGLKALYTGERAHLMEFDVYTEDMGRAGFRPDLGNRYTYFSAAEGHVLGMAERDTFSVSYQVVPADPAGRYFRGTFSTFAATGCPVTPAELPHGKRAGLGVTVVDDPSEPVFIGAAAANLDDDATVDCWSIATVERRAADGTRIPAGVPHNEVNDL